MKTISIFTRRLTRPHRPKTLEHACARYEVKLLVPNVLNT